MPSHTTLTILSWPEVAEALTESLVIFMAAVAAVQADLGQERRLSQAESRTPLRLAVAVQEAVLPVQFAAHLAETRPLPELYRLLAAVAVAHTEATPLVEDLEEDLVGSPVLAREAAMCLWCRHLKATMEEVPSISCCRVRDMRAAEAAARVLSGATGHFPTEVRVEMDRAAASAERPPCMQAAEAAVEATDQE